MGLQQFGHTLEAIQHAKEQGMKVIAAEITKDAIPLDIFSQQHISDIAIIFGNEVDGILDSTLKLVDHIVFIPMQGIKESLNVGQSSAIFMRALSSASKPSK